MYLPVDWPVPDLVARRARLTPDRTALVDAGTGDAWTYGQLSAGPVDALAAGIHRAGIPPGSHLGVLVRPGVGMAQVAHAAARAGVVFVPLGFDAPAEVISDRCAAADVDALLCDAETEAVATRVFDGPVVTIDPSDASGVTELDGSGDSPASYWWIPDSTQWLVFTSGTLGTPKAVELTARNMFASATASALRLGVDPNDRWLACLPMHHVGGLAPLVRSALYGTTVVVQSGFDPERTAAAMTTHDVSVASLVPTMLTRLLDAGWTPPNGLRFVLLGGAPAPPALLDRCAALGVPVAPTYGSTETASQIATARPDEAVAHHGTVGRPLPGTAVLVLDDGGVTPVGEPGELVVSGPTVSPGYYDDPTTTADRFTDRGFLTRDRGYRDEAGRLWMLGRLDDAIVTGGETVQSDGIAAVLRDHPAVEAAVVVGLDDAEWGEIVAAMVSGPDDTDRSALRAHCRDRLEPVAVPKRIAVTDELPRTASGTVDRQAVRERLGGDP